MAANQPLATEPKAEETGAEVSAEAEAFRQRETKPCSD